MLWEISNVDSILWVIDTWIYIDILKLAGTIAKIGYTWTKKPLVWKGYWKTSKGVPLWPVTIVNDLHVNATLIDTYVINYNKYHIIYYVLLLAKFLH